MAEHKRTQPDLPVHNGEKKVRLLNKLREPLQPFVKAIESTTVVYTVDPKILPFSLVDTGRLLALMRERLKCGFKAPDYNAQRLQSLGLDVTRLKEESLLTFLLKTPNPQARFADGRFDLDERHTIAIVEVAFTDENIAAKVRGITDVAEAVVAEAFNILGESAGSSVRWDDGDVQDNIALVSYESVTHVDLGVDMKALLNPQVRDFLDKNVSEGQRLGPGTMAYSRYDGFQPSETAVASWTFDEVTVKFHVFDKVTGRSSTSILDIDTKTRDERGRGIALVSSELPFDAHVQLLASLRPVLG